LEIGGLEVFLARVARPCALKAWSEESAKKLVALLEDPFVLSKAIVEMAAQVAGGRVFVKATYNLEVSGFAVVIAHDQLQM